MVVVKSHAQDINRSNDPVSGSTNSHLAAARAGRCIDGVHLDLGPDRCVNRMHDLRMLVDLVRICPSIEAGD